MLKNQTGIDKWAQSGMITILDMNLNSMSLTFTSNVSVMWWMDSSLSEWQCHRTLAVSFVTSYPHTITHTLWIRDRKLYGQTFYHRNNLPLIEQDLMEWIIEKMRKPQLFLPSHPTISFHTHKHTHMERGREIVKLGTEWGEETFIECLFISIYEKLFE